MIFDLADILPALPEMILATLALVLVLVACIGICTRGLSGLAWLMVLPACLYTCHGTALGVWGVLVAGTALASFVAMNFTGSSTYTSPSGVEFEMRKAIPWQLAGALGGAGAFIVGVVVR